MRFKIVAKTSRLTPAYVIAAESNQNLPARTLPAAVTPIQNDVKPRRVEARNARAPTGTASNMTVTGSRYVVEARNPRPTDESTAAYAGEQIGQITGGSIDTPMPGTARAHCFQVRSAMLHLGLVIQAFENRAVSDRAAT
jgi:hypothetical protein